MVVCDERLPSIDLFGSVVRTELIQTVVPVTLLQLFRDPVFCECITLKVGYV